MIEETFLHIVATTLTKLIPPQSCHSRHSSLTSPNCSHTVTYIYIYSCCRHFLSMIEETFLHIVATTLTKLIQPQSCHSRHSSLTSPNCSHTVTYIYIYSCCRHFLSMIEETFLHIVATTLTKLIQPQSCHNRHSSLTSPNCSHTVTYIYIYSCCRHLLSMIEETFLHIVATTLTKLIQPQSCHNRHSSLTSPNCSHTVTYIYKLTGFSSLHNFSSCSTASQLFPSHFLRAKLRENCGVSLVTFTHILYIHLPNFTLRS